MTVRTMSIAHVDFNWLVSFFILIASASTTIPRHSLYIQVQKRMWSHSTTMVSSENVIEWSLIVTSLFAKINWADKVFNKLWNKIIHFLGSLLAMYWINLLQGTMLHWLSKHYTSNNNRIVNLPEINTQKTMSLIK